MNPELNLKEKDLLKTGKKGNNATNLCMKQYLNIKKNILSLFFENENLLSSNKKKKKHSSQPKTKLRRLNLKRRNNNNLFNKIISQKYNNKDTIRNIENEKISEGKNNEQKKEINQNKINNEAIDKKFEIEKDNKALNKNDYSSNDINKYLSNDMSSFKNNDNLGLNRIENNSDMNLYNINNNDNLSDKSSKNSIKNKINNLSSSSFSKNFILKSELCKSAAYRDSFYRHNKINRSDGNPIINYFSQDLGKNENNIKNFYLSTAKNSLEEIDQNNYMNFFPINEDSTKNQKNIMSCNYNDKDQVHEEIYPDIFSGEEKDFRFAEFQNKENDENKYTLELIKKKAMKIRNEEHKDNKENNNIEEVKENSKQININTINQDNDSLSTEIKTANLVKSSLKNLTTNTNNYIIENNAPENNNINSSIKSDDQTPLSFVNNIYYINNSNYKQYQINPIFNNTNPNSYYGANGNQNQYNNYLNNNYIGGNYYNFINYQNQNDYFKSIMNGNVNNNNLGMNNNIPINNYKGKNVNINNNQDNQNIINNNSIENSKINNHNSSNDNYYEYSNEEILNLSIELIKEQVGCRFMQEKIKNDHNFANELLFQKIQNNLKELSCDSFGNYFLQAFIEILTFDNINKLFDLIQKDFTDICISPHGTRVIQKLIEKISSTPILINKFIYNLNNKDLGIIFKSPYGNHVIQKFLASNILEYCNFIFNYVYKNFMDIAQSKHGVCIIQKCVNEGDENHREKIYKLILMNFNNLIKDQFGNYLIQYILINTKTKEKFQEILPLLKKIEETMLELCKSKFSANVIEKCFENGENISREFLMKALINLSSDKIMKILLDNFGIYVIQKALKYPNVNYRNKIIELILEKRNELSNINFNDYNYKIIQKVINSNKDLSDIFSKINNIYLDNNYQDKEDRMNKNYSYNNNYNNRGKNKKGKKYYKGYNNNY